MRRLLVPLVIGALLAAACTTVETSAVSAVAVPVADGLINPVGLARAPDGRVFIAEEGTGEDDDSGAVSVLTPQGDLYRVVEGLPSGRDSGDLSGVALVGVDPGGSFLFVGNFGAGHLWRIPLDELPAPGQPALRPDRLERTMEPLNEVALRNPFDVAFDDAGRPVVSDASENGVAVETDDGTTRFVHRFADLPDPGKPEVTIDPVPTGIARVGDEYFVTLTGGCPYPPGAGRLVAIDGRRGERVVVDGLDMPIDVATDDDGTVWVLEFARFADGGSCFTGADYLPNTGWLGRIGSGGDLERLLPLSFPGAVLPVGNGRLYVTEVFTGQLLEIRIGDETVGGPPVRRIEAAARPWHFENVAQSVGLDFRHGAFASAVSPDPVAAMGGGLCWIDIDGDGWLDLYLVNSHALDEVEAWTAGDGLPRNGLYRNVGGTFESIGSGSGADLAMRGNGCVAADFDLDGDPDLYVTADGPDALLWNQGDGTFVEGASTAGIDAPEWNSAAVVGDVDGDGWPDLFVAAYLDLEVKIAKPSGAFPQDHPGIADRLYLSQGRGADGRVTFVERALDAGLSRNDRTLGALFSDLDGDGDLDLYLANDGQANRLHVNESQPGRPAFVDVTDASGTGDTGSGMGVAGGDYDGDQRADLFVTNWRAEVNALYRNELDDVGSLSFRYSTYRIGISGLGSGKTGWGTAWADFDLDGDLDLVVANGHVPVTDLETDRELVRLYLNRSAEGDHAQFRDWTTQVGLSDVGPLLARGSAVADFDNDGDLDVAVATIGGGPALLRNDDPPPGHWLQVELAAFAPGAMVTVTLADGRVMTREVHAGSSYLASEDPRLHFGLGSADQPVSVVVRWPDGRESDLADVAVDRIIRFG